MFLIDAACPICGGGSVGVRRSSDPERLVLMCDECQAVWLEPGNIAASAALFPAAPDFRVPGCAFSIASPASGWATREEVEAARFGDYVEGEGRAADGG